MARNTRRRSVRRDENLDVERPVQLQPARRFQTASGFGGPVRTARALTAAFGEGTSLYEQIIDKRNEKGQAEAVNEAAKGGSRDAENENKGYNETFDMIEAEHDLASFARELPQMLQEADWEKLTHEEVQAKVDEYYAGQLAGINPESLYGKNVAVGILKQNAALLETHRGILKEQEQQEYRVKAYENIREEFQRDGTIDFQKFADITKGLDKPKETYLNSIIDLAEEFGAPELMEQMPERFTNGDPTGKTDPALKDVFDNALATAHAKKKTLQKEADDKFNMEHQTELAKTHSLHKNMADAQDPAVLPLIAAGGERGPDGEPKLYSRAQQTALYDRFMNASQQAGIDDVAGDLYTAGHFIGGTAAERDAAFGVALTKYRASLDPDMPEEERQQKELDWVIDRSVVNGWLPSPLKDQLGVTVYNPQRFDEAAELAEAISARAPGFLAGELTNKQLMRFDLYRKFKNETGGSAERAIEQLDAYDETRSSIDTKATNDAIQTIIDDMGDVTLGTRRLVTDTTKFYINSGYEPEVAAAYAKAHVDSRVVKVGDYHYERGGVWGNDPQAAHDWMIENEALHSGRDMDDISVIPTGDGLTFAFQYADEDLPDITKVFHIDTAVQDFKRYEAELLNHNLSLYETSTDERLKQAEDRAFDAMFPHADMNYEVRAMSHERWRKLDPETKKQLIAAQLK